MLILGSSLVVAYSSVLPEDINIYQDVSGNIIVEKNHKKMAFTGKDAEDLVSSLELLRPFLMEETEGADRRKVSWFYKVLDSIKGSLKSVFSIKTLFSVLIFSGVTVILTRLDTMLDFIWNKLVRLRTISDSDAPFLVELLEDVKIVNFIKRNDYNFYKQLLDLKTRFTKDPTILLEKPLLNSFKASGDNLMQAIDVRRNLQSAVSSMIGFIVF